MFNNSDSQSLNGVFINKRRIPTETPTRLNVTDVLGIGAVNNSSDDYFVFEICQVDVNQVLDKFGDSHNVICSHGA